MSTLSSMTTHQAVAPDLEQEERNKQAFITLIEEVFNKGNLDLLDNMISEDVVEHQFFGPDHPRGIEGVAATVRDLRGLFGDFKLTIEDIVASGDTVWARMTGGGVHQREFYGTQPTNRRTKVAVIDICRYKDGKMIEHWGVPDRFHLLIQLGAWPPQPQAPR